MECNFMSQKSPVFIKNFFVYDFVVLRASLWNLNRIFFPSQLLNAIETLLSSLLERISVKMKFDSRKNSHVTYFTITDKLQTINSYLNTSTNNVVRHVHLVRRSLPRRSVTRSLVLFGLGTSKLVFHFSFKLLFTKFNHLRQTSEGESIDCISFFHELQLLTSFWHKKNHYWFEANSRSDRKIPIK